MEMSIDRLTVCGNIFGDLESFYKQTIEVEGRSFAKYPYRDTIYFKDGSVLQIGEVEAVRKGNIKELRYDFNPNNKVYEKLHMQVIGLMKNVHITRCDVAFDVYDVDMSTWKWIDSMGRPYNVYYSGTGAVETWYIGGKDSEMRIRIYNKAKEQKIKGKVWWRVEVQMRSRVCEKMMEKKEVYNPFEHISPVVPIGYEELDVKKRAMVKYLLENPSGFSELGSQARAEYRRIIRMLGSWECIDFYSVWNKKSSLVASEVESWLCLAREI